MYFDNTDGNVVYQWTRTSRVRVDEVDGGTVLDNRVWFYWVRQRHRPMNSWIPQDIYRWHTGVEICTTYLHRCLDIPWTCIMFVTTRLMGWCCKPVVRRLYLWWLWFVKDMLTPSESVVVELAFRWTMELFLKLPWYVNMRLVYNN
jgi:hypothetical protein